MDTNASNEQDQLWCQARQQEAYQTFFYYSTMCINYLLFGHGGGVLVTLGLMGAMKGEGFSKSIWIVLALLCFGGGFLITGFLLKHLFETTQYTYEEFKKNRWILNREQLIKKDFENIEKSKTVKNYGYLSFWLLIAGIILGSLGIFFGNFGFCHCH